MKFSDVEETAWDELRPYVDTCVLPVTGLTGSEQPWEATRALEQLRDALDCLEIPYKGRVLTYPAFHFITDEECGSETLKRVCARLKNSGFRYLIVIGAKAELENILSESGADCALTLPPVMLNDSLPEVKRQIAQKLQQLWSANSEG
ncbi:DUF2487 family protein [Paenibacillus piri]|uniref:DUF2487 family protein n=1 Tax=Paenibacillus piri TaxID=2547395 RepID=A0A4R5KW64_9BACL|nr:DUF2487 family protein [Paenibacillus piri]TDF99365.1 DUF2487 family protein [Paenibacillus piri]